MSGLIHNRCYLPIVGASVAACESPDELTEAFRRRASRSRRSGSASSGRCTATPSTRTAESVYEAVRGRDATISLRTVYQTLNDLAAMGELRQLALGTGSARFDPNLERPPSPGLRPVRQGARRLRRPRALEVPPADRQGFTIDRDPGRVPGHVRRVRATPDRRRPRSHHPNQPARGDHPCLISRAARPRPT